MKHLYIIIFLLVASSCTQKLPGDKVYIEYLDYGERLHIDRQCKNYGKGNEVKYINTSALTEKDFDNSYCPKCVSDEAADYINEIIRNNADTSQY